MSAARAAGGLAVLGALALAVVVGVEPRDAPAVRGAVVAVATVVVAATIAAGRRRQRARSRDWFLSSVRAMATASPSSPAPLVAGAVVWGVLVVAFAAWDGVSFSGGRRSLPTLSHYIGLVTAFGWGRSLLFLGWAAWGGWLALGWRRPRR